MRLAIWLVSLSMLLPGGVANAETLRNPQIEAVIQQQIDAFQVDDFKKAFEFASPTIQKRFGSAERFGFVVIHRYPMVWRAQSTSYFGLEQYANYALQKVMITDYKKTLHILVYEMLPLGNTWRIGGVQIMKLPGSDT